MNLRSEAVGSHPVFITRGEACQNHYFGQSNLETIYMVRGEKAEEKPARDAGVNAHLSLAMEILKFIVFLELH